MKNTLPYSLSIKPVGSVCNLDCGYCYYLERNTGCGSPMTTELLESVIEEHIQSQPKDATVVDFHWHGGEPLLRGKKFFHKAIELQNRYASDTSVIKNTIQTNGTLIDEAWAKFFKKHNIMLGISIDGPQLLNDLSRIDIKGDSSFKKTIQGLNHLREQGVVFNTLTVVNNRTYLHADTVYNFLKQSGSHYLQFQPCIDHELDRRSEYNWSLSGEQWGQFLCRIFDLWCEEDVCEVYVQFFENCLMILMGHPSQMCHHSKTCGQQLMLEADGSVYSCDHFGYSEYQLGNISQNTLMSMVNSTQQTSFGNAKYDNLNQECRRCDFVELCQGGCPKNRTDTSANGEKMNHLCEGYKVFFHYALPRLLQMVNAMKNGYSPRFYQLF